MKLVKYFNFFIKIILTYFFYIFLLPVVLLIILLRPLIHLKFGLLNSMRFGRFIGSLTNYSLTKSNNGKINSFDFIGYEKPIMNKQLKKMFDRKFKTFSFSSLIDILEKSLKFWTRHDLYSAKVRTGVLELKDLDKAILNCPINFTKDEILKGELSLKKLNLSSNTPFICFHNRDSNHLKKYHTYMNFNYHSYRNFTVNTFRLAAEKFTDSGFNVLRIGSDAEERLITNNNKIVDYIFSGIRSDFLDIFLALKSKAYFGSDSGMSNIFQLFGKPTFCMNTSLTGITMLSRCYSGLFIPQHLFHKKENKNIGVRKMFKLGMHGFHKTEHFESCGIKIVTNSEEEIADFAAESINFINGKDIFSSEDRELQKKFWNIYFENDKKLKTQDIRIKISPTFLRKNKYLLE